jgi:hypothetical protein
MLLTVFIWLILKHCINCTISDKNIATCRHKLGSVCKLSINYLQRVNVTIFHMYIQLFHFDVHEDVRTIADATIEKDEVHFLSSHRSYLFEIQVYNIILKTGQMHVFLCVF